MLKKSLSFQHTKINGTITGIANNKINNMYILILRKDRLVGQTRNRKIENKK